MVAQAIIAELPNTLFFPTTTTTTDLPSAPSNTTLAGPYPQPASKSSACTLAPTSKTLTISSFILLLLVGTFMLIDLLTPPVKLPRWLKTFGRRASAVEKTACLTYLLQRLLYHILAFWSTTTTTVPNPKPAPLPSLLAHWSNSEPYLQALTSLILVLAVIPHVMLKRCNGERVMLEDDDEEQSNPLEKPSTQKRVSFSDVLEVHYYDQTEAKRSVSFDEVLHVWHYEQV